jgi:hypothetical protein
MPQHSTRLHRDSREVGLGEYALGGRVPPATRVVEAVRMEGAIEMSRRRYHGGEITGREHVNVASERVPLAHKALAYARTAA